MNGSIKQTNYKQYRLYKSCEHTDKIENIENIENADSTLVAENCNFSVYSMAAAAGGFLMCLGIILYAILTA